MKTILRVGNRFFIKGFYEKRFSIAIRPAIHNPLLGILNVKYVTESQITLLMKFKRFERNIRFVLSINSSITFFCADFWK